MRYLPLLWPVQQSGAAVQHNDAIVTLGLLSKQLVLQTPKSHVSLVLPSRHSKCHTKNKDNILYHYEIPESPEGKIELGFISIK